MSKKMPVDYYNQLLLKLQKEKKKFKHKISVESQNFPYYRSACRNHSSGCQNCPDLDSSETEIHSRMLQTA